LNVLDENLFPEHAELLASWHIHSRQIGRELGRRGMLDDEIIALLHGLQRPTLFTLDSDFYRPGLRHDGYCLVWAEVAVAELPLIIRRFLRHPTFNTEAKRLGNIVHLSLEAVHYWPLHASQEQLVIWSAR
jgi:hypothetical protein